MKLELKHFVGYPKTLGLMLEGSVFNRLEGLDFDHDSVIAERINFNLDEVEPCLHPLSDIMKEITHEGETFVPLDKLKERWEYIQWAEEEEALFFFVDVDFIHFNSDKQTDNFKGTVGTEFTQAGWVGPLNDMLPKWIWDQLQEWHFDVHDLISNKLARRYGDFSRKRTE